MRGGTDWNAWLAKRGADRRRNMELMLYLQQQQMQNPQGQQQQQGQQQPQQPQAADVGKQVKDGISGVRGIRSMLQDMGLLDGGTEAAGAALGNAAAPAVSSGMSSVGSGVMSGGELAGNGLFTPAATNMSVGTPALDGGAAAAPGSTMATVAPYLGAAMAAKGGYDIVQGFNRNGEGVRSGLTQVGAGLGTIALPGVGTAAGAAVGNFIGYGLQGNGIKNDLALAARGPMGWGVLAAKKTGLISKLMHKTTRQVASEHTQDLLSKGTDDKAYQNYVAGMREQYNAAPPDPSKPFHGGQYGSWDEYKAAGLDAGDLTGVYGNIKAYGPQWASLSEDQRKRVTQANIDSGLYNSRKGEVELSDEAKALENRDRILKEVAANTPLVPKSTTMIPRTGKKAANYQAGPRRF